MSNFSSIGVSVYEITRDWRVTCPFPPAGDPRVHTETHEGADAAPPQPRRPPASPPGLLPPALAAALAAFERHLRSERSLSPHTVRAYAGDIASLLAVRQPPGRRHAGRPGRDRTARLARDPARVGRGARHAGPARRRGPGLHRLRPPPRLAGHRPGPAARHAEDPPYPAARAAQGRDGRRADRPGPGRAPSEATSVPRQPNGPRQPAQPARPSQPRPKPPWPCATPPCSSCSTRPASGSASCAGWTPATSTRAAAPSGSGARATRNAPCRSACPRCAR